jgi:hypothetical protein
VQLTSALGANVCKGAVSLWCGHQLNRTDMSEDASGETWCEAPPKNFGRRSVPFPAVLAELIVIFAGFFVPRDYFTVGKSGLETS